MSWDTKVVVDAIKQKLKTAIVTVEPGSEHTAEIIKVAFSGIEDYFTVTAFSCDEDFDSTKAGVTVEIRNKKSYSRGGVWTDNEGLAVAAAKVSVLIKRMGHNPVPNMHDYF